jgi:hypothetical protein
LASRWGAAGPWPAAAGPWWGAAPLQQVLGAYQPWGEAFSDHHIVRVESASGDVLTSLSYADSTELQPPRALALMRGAGASARYYGAYCARLYLGRAADLPAEGTIGNDPSAPHGAPPIGNDPSAPPTAAANNGGDAGAAVASKEGAAAAADGSLPYALPWYELRRLLALARAHGEPFRVSYTRLPPSATRGTPSAWRDYAAGERVTLEEDPATGMRRCTMGHAGAACAASEQALAFAAAPPAWLTKVLMAYPVPLLPESPADPGSEIHCSA